MIFDGYVRSLSASNVDYVVPTVGRAGILVLSLDRRQLLIITPDITPLLFSVLPASIAVA